MNLCIATGHHYHGRVMLSLRAGEVHTWTALVPPTLTSDLEATLSDGERSRANRFRFNKHRSAYVFAHAVLRDVLSHYLYCPPRDIEFGESAFGKPFVVDKNNAKVPQFNLSHAGLVVLVAVSGERSVGIDVEEIRPIEEFQLIAKRNFTRLECAYVLGQALENRDRRFFRCWTRKEAYIKAIGKGLSIPLDSFETLLGPGQPVGPSTDVVDAHGTKWFLEDIDAPANYMAALAVEDGIDRLVHLQWKADRIAQ